MNQILRIVVPTQDGSHAIRSLRNQQRGEVGDEFVERAKIAGDRLPEVQCGLISRVHESRNEYSPGRGN